MAAFWPLWVVSYCQFGGEAFAGGELAAFWPLWVVSCCQFGGEARVVPVVEPLGPASVKSQARVVVIGGGVVGASVLYHLTKAGWADTVLVGRTELTAGSTWHSAGGMHTHNGDPNVARLQRYTTELYAEIERVSGQDCGIHMPGGVMLADTPERLDWLKMTHARGRYLGMGTELVSVAEADRVRAETLAVRATVGLMETTGFAKFLFSGPGARVWLDRLLAGRIPMPGRMALTPMTNPAGNLIGDLTVACLPAAPGRAEGPAGTVVGGVTANVRDGEPFVLFGSGVAERYYERWFDAHLPEDGSVSYVTLGAEMCGLAIAGPASRALLAEGTAGRGHRRRCVRARHEVHGLL